MKDKVSGGKDLNILWVTAINECEYDITQAFEGMKKHDLQILCPTAKNDYFFYVDLTKAPITYTGTLETLSIRLSEILKEGDIDLVIKRAGWGTQKKPDLVPQIARHYGVPCAIWCAEQGEQRDWQLDIASHYDLILANNLIDVEWYKIKRPDARVYLFPFGCVPKFHKPVKPVEKYETDLVCYGNPLYTEYDAKRRCIEDMVLPFTQARSPHSFSIWGLETWKDIRGVKDSGVYKGQFPYLELPKVNSSAKIHLGISANIFWGGYGSKLVRALACGVFTIWHETMGARRDFRDGYHLQFTNGPGHTEKIVDYFMENEQDRKRIARQGMEFAHENYDYKYLFESLFAVMGADDVL